MNIGSGQSLLYIQEVLTDSSSYNLKWVKTVCWYSVYQKAFPYHEISVLVYLRQHIFYTLYFNLFNPDIYIMLNGYWTPIEVIGKMSFFNTEKLQF